MVVVFLKKKLNLKLKDECPKNQKALDIFTTKSSASTEQRIESLPVIPFESCEFKVKKLALDLERNQHQMLNNSMNSLSFQPLWLKRYHKTTNKNSV